MSTKNILAVSIAAVLVPHVQNASIEQREPGCTVAMPAESTPSTCPKKEPWALHDEPRNLKIVDRRRPCNDRRPVRRLQCVVGGPPSGKRRSSSRPARRREFPRRATWLFRALCSH